MVNVVNPNFGETNHCVSFASSSFGLPHNLYLSFIYASTSIYSVVLFLCVQGCGIYSLTPTEALHQIAFVLELVKGRINLFVQIMRRTGLTGLPDRSNRLVADNCVKCFNLQD